MPNRPSQRNGPSVRATTYRQGPFEQRLFSQRHRPKRRLARPRFAGRWTAMRLCFCGAALLIACAIAIPSLVSPTAAADIDAENRALEEAAQLQNGNAGLPRTATLDVPAVQQYPELPTGCESVALTNALMSLDFELGKTDIADSWLPRSESDFITAFMGDPHSTDGNSCMAPAIVQTADAFLMAQGSPLRATDLTGSSFADVLVEAAAGNPVVVWCTIALGDSGNAYGTAKFGERTYRLYTNSHCVVVSGYDLDQGVVYVSDSLAGQVSYDLETFATRYYEVGAQAVVIK